MTAIISIPNLFKEIAEKVSAAMLARTIDPFEVYFDFGHYTEVTRNLTEKDGSTTNKNKKYPLIWLVMDFVERFGATPLYCELPDLQIFIATVSRADTTAAQRIEQSFNPRLYPIYKELLYQIEVSGYFEILSSGDLPHEKIDRPYWGGKGAKGDSLENVFNDFIDAIEIRKLKLFVSEQTCERFKILAA